MQDGEQEELVVSGLEGEPRIKILVIVQRLKNGDISLIKLLMYAPEFEAPSMGKSDLLG
jgi:hypothetical protein